MDGCVKHQTSNTEHQIPINIRKSTLNPNSWYIKSKLSALLHRHAHGYRAPFPSCLAVSPSCPSLPSVSSPTLPHPTFPLFLPTASPTASGPTTASPNPPSASTGRHDDDSLPGAHPRGVFAAEIDDLFFLSSFLSFLLFFIFTISPPLPHPQIPPTRPLPPARQTIRTKNPPFAQNADLHRDAELNVAHHALPAAVLAPPAAVRAEAEFAQNHWVPALEHLGVGDARVGHVRVHAAGAGPGRAGAGSTGDGFVVAEAFGGAGGGGEVAAEAEGEVVAVALGGGAGLEAVEDDVGDALALLAYWEKKN